MSTSSYVRRITPADAGKTSDMPIYAPQHRDHPRGCGENSERQYYWHRIIGSPPRMRGKLPLHNAIIAYFRITPADAGKTFFVIFLPPYHNGSPPRMRGKHGTGFSIHIFSRITPADAGKTNNAPNAATRCGDHPRGCGENDNGDELLGICVGSPPRMRGKPARTARTDSCRLDHPRGCGENLLNVSNRACLKGSPPRMRGKHSTDELTPEQIRITPADAGKTLQPQSYRLQP